jgi:hypothetical protein
VVGVIGGAVPGALIAGLALQTNPDFGGAFLLAGGGVLAVIGGVIGGGIGGAAGAVGGAAIAGASSAGFDE